MISDNDGDNFLGESDGSSNFHRSKENSHNLRLRNPISTASESLDVEMMSQVEGATKEDSKRKTHSQHITWFSSTRRTVSQIARCLSPCLKLANRHRGISLLITLVLGVILYLHFKQVHMRYMGKHALHGGRIGQRIDAFFTRSYAQSVYETRKTEFIETGVDFPDLLNVGLAGILELQTNDALRETISRAETMANQLRTLETKAEEYENDCLSSTEPASTVYTELPRYIFVPEHHAMMYPVPDYLSRIPFRTANMRSFIKVNYNSLLKTFDSLGTLESRTNLWALAVVYHFGGIYIGNHANDILLSSVNVLRTLFQKQKERVDEHCRKPTSVIAFAKDLGSGSSHQSELALIVATPRHPHLKCVLDRLTTKPDPNLGSITRGSFFASSAFSADTTDNLWREFRMQTTGTVSCSIVAENRGIDGIEALADTVQRVDDHPRVFATILNSLPTNEATISSPKSYINEESRMDTSKSQRKRPLRSLMKSRGIEPGWLCARCLRAPVMGTLQKCSFFCPTGYADLICSPKPETTIHDVTLHIGPQFQHILPLQPRIPRIVHQSWFEDISLEAYPQLSRLQNSWITSGWEYRFYDDGDARDYIDKNFPKHFVGAYDALVPGAFKADFFRYLVLLKDGGVWADIDILLETNLDAFVAPNLSFFAPRDVVCTYADAAFCLWNGFMGSAPGHPAIVKAAETTMNLINQRADFYDMESDLCRKNGITLESWKYRSEPSLTLSGPCALGIAVNEALNRSSVATIPFGLLESPGYEKKFGDILILVGDKDDLGAFRFSDPERTTIVASTDLNGLDKKSRGIKYPLRAEMQPKGGKHLAPHYSETQKQRVWGEHFVYHNDMVVDEQIRFNVVADRGI